MPANRPTPPVAKKIPVVIEQLGRTRTDDYQWMKDDNWQAVLRDPTLIKAEVKEHLDAENAYREAMMASTLPLQETMFREMRGRIKEDDSSVPASDGAWGKEAGKTFQGGVGEGAKGNEGTSAAVKGTKGAVSYNEWSFAKSQKLSVAKIVTSAGPDAVELTTASAGKSIDGVKIKGTGNDLVLDTSSFYKPTAAGAYPIMMPTYEIVCSKYEDADTAKAVKAFLTTAVTTGQKGLEDNGYIPLPAQFTEKLKTAVAAIS